jgi:hypothetical protein
MDDEYPKLTFPSISEEDIGGVLADAEMKGWSGAGVAEASDGKIYPVTFMTALRCASEVEYSGAVVDEALIVVRNTTLEEMKAAVKLAWERGFFRYLRPIDPDSREPLESA